MKFEKLLADPEEGCRFLLDRVATTRSSFPIRPAHLVADLCLLGYGRDLLEHGAGLLSLGSAADALPALTLARAAKEAADEMVLLATSEAYDLEGSRAFALSAFEAVSLNERLISSRTFMGESDPNEPDQDSSRWKSYLEEIQAAAERLSSGSGGHLGDAIRELEAKPRKLFGRWERGNVAELLSRAYAQLLGATEGSTNSEAPSPQFFSAQFSTLSMWAHPRPRANPKSIALSAEGRVQVEVFGNDAESLVRAAHLTLLNALMIGDVSLRFVHGLAEGT